MTQAPAGRGRATSALALVGALGVVFGDIGTSPLYAATAVVATARGAGVEPDRTFVYGMTSTILWTLTLVVSILYVRLFLRADNDGEGGLLALLGLLRRTLGRSHGGRRATLVVTVLGMLGAAMFLGDSVITPAISVLSAVEGLEVVEPSLARFVVPLALAILASLFLVERFGTRAIGRLFGPVMLLWFATLAACGVRGVVETPDVLVAVSPHWVVLFFLDHPAAAFLSLGAVVLAVTGAEALYADLGHFGRRPIARAWTFVVFPALALSYLGQGGHLIASPEAARNPFFSLVPAPLAMPVVVLATLATIIASQAVVSGAFSVVHQGGRLGVLPPLRTVHTSSANSRQIYLPAVNVLLAVAVLLIVLAFRSSGALASAYGIAVTLTISITTVVYLAHTWTSRRRPTGRFVVAGSILVLVLVLLAANLAKVGSGGWLPLTVGALVFVVMTTWWTGRRHVDRGRLALETTVQRVEDVLEAHGSVTRTRGTAVFLSRHRGVVPLALRSMVEQNHALQRHVLLVSWATSDRPVVPAGERYRAAPVGDEGVVEIVATYGFRERPRVVRLLAQVQRDAPDLMHGVDLGTATYFVSLSVPRSTPRSRMPRWSQRLFLGLYRLVPDPVETLDLPRERTIVLSRDVPL
ncbi:KUP/HAK/KT family potassium transporter [Oerskovia jenensis]|uniref:Probable potassium transport system protein Kup n=1 Tax=Oerskovia jenensis TaxID=162169 RepID=A0ABS2LF11_9CELL|nr:KUP/HAK/KT family potassium transporter [Oerskovia jenensis]MBM7478962.1 KUP system potassium uptake protein [Oerskovia jenensis]